MLLRDNPRSFLTGDDPFLPTVPLETSEGRVDQQLLFELRHEGFVGIPHGGLGMGLCLDAWRRTGMPSYPVSVRFKFGGSGIGISDEAVFSVERKGVGEDSIVSARITKNGDKSPYLRAEIARAGATDIPETLRKPPPEAFRPLPYYKNCFVCGHHREIVGLQRRFRVHPNDHAPLVTTSWGQNSEDQDRAESFLIGEHELHPAVLISIFDENTAWGGFMRTKSAGLSVRLDFTLLRPVGHDEPLLFMSRPTGIRGNPRAPRFFVAEGSILSLSDATHPEPVAFGKGEWIIMDLYTEQIKKNLLPADDWEWIFS
jgi:hypothetical protein